MEESKLSEDREFRPNKSEDTAPRKHTNLRSKLAIPNNLLDNPRLHILSLNSPTDKLPTDKSIAQSASSLLRLPASRLTKVPVTSQARPPSTANTKLRARQSAQPRLHSTRQVPSKQKVLNSLSRPIQLPKDTARQSAQPRLHSTRQAPSKHMALNNLSRPIQLPKDTARLN